MTEWAQIGKISMFRIEIEKIFKAFSEDVKAGNVLTAAELSHIQSQFQRMLKQSSAAMDEALKAANPKTAAHGEGIVENKYEIVKAFVHTSRRFEKRYCILKSRRSKLSQDISEAEKLFVIKKEAYETVDSNDDHSFAD
jgi:sugar-specific transcriptional regulator TrmB